MTKYVTFWFPTIFHKDLKSSFKGIYSIPDFRIDDDSDFPYYCTLNFQLKSDEEDKNQIEIISKLTKEDRNIQTFTVVLKEEDASNNGFATYSCDDSTVPEDIRDAFFGEDCLTKQIYHKIKEFYHKHEANEKDNTLIAKIKDTLDEEKIDKIDNDFLIGFLENFEKMFCDYAKTISHSNFLLQDKIKKYEYNNSQTLEDLIQETKKLSKFCENALIEYTYCKTLLNSIYNKSFRHDIILDPTIDDETKIERRRKALNIRNAIRYIENIKYKNSNRQNYLLSEILKDGERTQRISLTLGFIGVCYALIFGYKGGVDNDQWLIVKNWWLICLLSISILGFIILFINTKWFIKIKYFFKRLFCNNKSL